MDNPKDFVQMKCPNLSCGKVLAVPTATRGKTVRCRFCRTTIRVPGKPVVGSTKKAAG